MKKDKIVIYWARRDFRLEDNPALFQAVKKSKEENILFLPLFIIDNKLVNDNAWNIGYPRRVFLSKVLTSFAKNFKHFHIIYGDYLDVFKNIYKKYDIEIFVNHDVEDFSRKRDQQVVEFIGEQHFHSFRDQLSISKDVVSGTGNLYSVFSPFRNAVFEDFLKSKTTPKPDFNGVKFLEIQDSFSSNYICTDTKTTDFKDIEKQIFSQLDQKWLISVTPTYSIDLDKIFDRPDYSNWYTTEDEVTAQFKDFVSNLLTSYKVNRDSLELDVVGGGQTSKMSVALKWGLISARSLKDIILEMHQDTNQPGVFSFISELIWREFYRYILYHNPSVLNLEYQKRFQNNEIKWVDNKTAKYRFEKWIKGETGYEVVDAAMHQIAKTGWMHNRSRMIVASVLTKNLGVDWRWGQEYFRSVLLDLDEASNNGGWQWAASVGADPKPIRIFNPYLQQENYDKNKNYINFWLPDDYNIKEPIIDHKQAREEALKRYGLGGVKPKDYSTC